MSNFCECCGQPLPGSEEKVALFGGKLVIVNGIMKWDGGEMRMTPTESFVCMAIARKFPGPANNDFIIDYLEGCRAIDFQSDGFRVIDVHVSHIRTRMLDAGCPFHIQTVWGVGKQFAEGMADGRVLTASGYSREHWKAKRRAGR